MRPVAASAAAAALLASGALAATALAATKTVKVGDNWFLKASPNNPTLRLKKGDKATFRWVGKSPHNVAVTSGPVKFTSPTKTSGTYKRTFSRKGTYKLICTIHGASDQAMTIKVS